MTLPALVATTPDLAVVIAGQASPEVLAACRQSVQRHGGLDDLLDGLQAGGRLGIPDFGCVVDDGTGPIRVLVRGDVAIRIDDGAATIAAAPGLTTWREEVVETGHVFVFDCKGAETLRWAARASKPGDADGPDMPAGPAEPDEDGDLTLAEPPPDAPDATIAANEGATLAGAVEARESPTPPDDPHEGQQADVAPDAAEKSDAAPARGLISGVPAAGAAPDPPRPSPQTHQRSDQAPEPEMPPPPPGSPPAVPAPPPPTPTAPAPGVTTGGPADAEDDGRTIARSSGAGKPGTSAEGLPAVRCPQGHPNPPQSASCRSCGSAIEDPTIIVERLPVVARVRFGDGNLLDLDRPYIVGRRPTVPPGSDLGDLVGLHAVPDVEKELSRNHVELRLDGWSVTVVDLGSVNGTWVANPGKEPVRVRPHTPHPVVLGASVRLAEVASFVLEPPA